ncbi:hypothetical protein [Zooshikella ganghwensis]|uniref:Uncharacterized protein n=1 Tax=Zooshikella ganghwensis TaxID=202772 RepID=A0A4P9VNI3_9GAMM|nr:hypothetical protein [Zooshikella ganghwensis]RDH44973.1 hypothetical protein B9G39_16870 [Zooshikella ganghwensis]
MYRLVRDFIVSLFIVIVLLPTYGWSSQTVEEARIDQAQQHIPNQVNKYHSLIATFTQSLTRITNYSQLVALIDRTGDQLWQQSVSDNQAGALYDDRALYWGRLQLTQHLKNTELQFQITSSQLNHALLRLELASRGALQATFKYNTTHKVFITGFDPFQLDSNIRQSNPAGVTALMLDNTIIRDGNKTIEVQAINFPVRFADFDKGIVETALTPVLSTNQADLVMTVSMGRSVFDLERFPGLRRSSSAPDNLNVYSGGSYSQPIRPLLNGVELKGQEFIEFSLPVQAMLQVQQPFAIRDNRRVISLTGVYYPESLSELKGEISIEGSGGGYLSNEISYRTLWLRQQMRSTVPMGHLHTPRLYGYNQPMLKKIVQQIKTIIKKGV